MLTEERLLEAIRAAKARLEARRRAADDAKERKPGEDKNPRGGRPYGEPNAKSLEAFELRDGLWVLLATLVDDAPVSLPPFDAISFPLDALWPEIMTSASGDGENA